MVQILIDGGAELNKVKTGDTLLNLAEMDMETEEAMMKVDPRLQLTANRTCCCCCVA